MRGENTMRNIVAWLIYTWILCSVCQAEFRPMYHVAAQVDWPGALAVADFDGNGHPDLLVVSDDDHRMGWYANDWTGTFGPLQVIAEDLDEVTTVSTADLDGDGDTDIVSSAVSYLGSYRDTIIITCYANDGAGGFVSSQVIVSEDYEPQCLYASDIDGDDDLDILFSAFIPETIWNSRGDSNSPPDDPSLSVIGWYANDGAGRFDSLQTTTFEEIELQSTFMADVDADGYVDLLGVVDDYEIAWFRNDGSGQFEDRRVIDISTVKVNGLCTGDLSGDGNLDLLVASESYWGAPSLTWYASQGDGQFDPAQEIPAGLKHGDGYAVNILDVDNDGDLDVVAVHRHCVLACTYTLTWYANDGSGQFACEQIIAGAGGYESFSSLFAADLDNDGDLDILSVDRRKGQVQWFENGGLGYGPQVAIDTELDGANGVLASDFDGDGDLDVLATGSANSGFAWYENQGAWEFGPRQTIQEEISSSEDRPWYAENADRRRVCPADLDGDGDIDILASLYGDSERFHMYWYENDGAGTFDLRQVSAPEGNYTLCVLPADLDGDGDLDVLGYGGYVIWYANDGSGQFGPMQTIVARGVDNLSVADLDGDGDLDVITTLTWYANDGTGQFGPEQVISTETESVNGVHAADLDGDGDLDMLVTACDQYYFGEDTIRYIAWYKNDGTGQFGPIQEISSDIWAVRSIDAADLDGDGDLDVLVGAYNDDEIASFRNDGPEGFGEKQILFDRADGVNSVYAVDLDGDGDMDILSASSLDNTIALYDNE